MVPIYYDDAMHHRSDTGDRRILDEQIDLLNLKPRFLLYLAAGGIFEQWLHPSGLPGACLVLFFLRHSSGYFDSRPKKVCFYVNILHLKRECGMIEACYWISQLLIKRNADRIKRHPKMSIYWCPASEMNMLCVTTCHIGNSKYDVIDTASILDCEMPRLPFVTKQIFNVIINITTTLVGWR